MPSNGAAGDAGRSFHPLAGRAAGTETAAVETRRSAIAELGDALRDLVEQASATEVGEDLLRAVTVQVRQAAATLGERTRARADLPSADDLTGGYRMYNPVTGSGSGLAAPLRIELAGAGVVGRCTLGLAFEGPPTFAHGGVSAMLLDQLLGYAISAAGHPGMTGRLEVWYRAPVPLQVPLLLTAKAGEVAGRRIRAHGTLTTEADPDRVLVEANGVFVALRAEQAARLFGGVRPDATDPQVAHD